MELLLSINPKLTVVFYKYELDYEIKDFDYMCYLLNKYKNKHIIYLYFEIDEYDNININDIYDISKDELYKLVTNYAQILDEFNFYELFDRFGEDLITNCIKIVPSTILYFKQYTELNLGELVLINPFIVEYIDDYYYFKTMFIDCLKNLNRNDSLFIRKDTYDKYFWMLVILIFFYIKKHHKSIYQNILIKLF